MSSPPNQSFNNCSDNKQIVRHSSNRSSPSDQQWMARTVTPFTNSNNTYNTNDHNYRQVLNNMHFNNIGFQRVFTPRSSYFSPQQMPHNNHNYNPSPLFETPIRQTVDHFLISEVNNRPVYMTPDGNTNNSFNAETKSESPESTLSTDSTSNQMKELINQMKKLTDEEHDLKKNKKDVESKINALNEELKELENKIRLRDELIKVRHEFDKKEETFENKKRKLLSQMEKCSDSSQVINNDLTNHSKVPKINQMPNERAKVEMNLKKNINEKVMPTPERPSHKRPTISTTNSSAVKKLKTDDEIESSLRKETNKMAKSVPKTNERVLQKRPYIPNRFQKPNDGQSPKVNRIFRQQTPVPPVVTSGIKTSRPQKMSGSRAKPSFITDNTHQSSNTSQTSDESFQSSRNPIDSNNSESSSSKPVSDAESDNEVFSELSKCVPNEKTFSSNASDPKMSTDSVSNEDNHEKNAQFDESKQTHENRELNREENAVNSNINDQQMVSNTESSKDNDKNDDQTCSPKATENLGSNDLKRQKSIEIVELDDEADEEYETIPHLIIKEEKMEGITNEELESAEAERKKKVSEAANQLISDELKIAMRLKTKTSTESSDSCTDSSEEQSNVMTNKKDEVFKMPINPPIKRQRLRFNGFEPIKYPPTVPYSIGSFKAIAGPKSRTAKTVVVFLKPFRNYLFATFLDTSVRRYHIAEKDNILKYEGHQDFVRTLTIVCCDPTDETFYLYTGCKDGELRSFNGITAQFIRSFKLSDEITCLDFCYSHIFAGLNDGNLCRIKLFHHIKSQTKEEIQSSNYIEKFIISAGKRVSYFKALATDMNQTKFESILVATQTKLRIINTIPNIKNEDRILFSLSVSFKLPIFVQIYGKHLFISYALPSVKTEDKKRIIKNSKVLFYDLQKDWKPIREIDVNSRITFLELNNKDLVITCHSGEIRCIDSEKLELKWIAYNNKNLTASVIIGDRIITGNEEGLIDVVYLDQKMIDCDSCGVTYARHIDLKQHIKREHPVSDDSKPNQQN